jgi:predicted Rossmann fold flavoprotein
MASIFAARARMAAAAPASPMAREAGVLLLERTRDGGKKILMSGGGRCNVLPSSLDPARYVTASSPNTLRKLLLSWPLAEQRRFFEGELGIPLALEEETGKLFPVSNTARQVRDGLRALAEREGATMRFEAGVIGLEPSPSDAPPRGAPAGAARWAIRLAGGGAILADRVVVATGGLSVPATGRDGSGFDWMRVLGHSVHDTYPALTPLTAKPHRHAALSGVSLRVTLEAPGPRRSQTARGGFLFTHKGYSGPAVLDLSHLAVRSRRAGGPRQALVVQWCDLDEGRWDRCLREGAGTVAGALRRHVPGRLAEALLAELGVAAGTPLPHLDREARRRVVEAMTRYPLPWTGDEGYGKAEVTGGGVDLAEVAPRTLESRLHPGLHLCGEILDAFGPIGGYNFAWAWATGRLAGLGAGRHAASGERAAGESGRS